MQAFVSFAAAARAKDWLVKNNTPNLPRTESTEGTEAQMMYHGKSVVAASVSKWMAFGVKVKASVKVA